MCLQKKSFQIVMVIPFLQRQCLKTVLDFFINAFHLMITAFHLMSSVLHLQSKKQQIDNAAFSYILDNSRTNASTILALNKKDDPWKVNSLDFGWELVQNLTTY